MGITKSKKTPRQFHNVRCVFLDRDGVINRPVPSRFVTSCAEMELLPGVCRAIRALNRAHVKVIIVTNQRGIHLGLCSHEELARIHGRMQQLLANGEARVDAIYYCPHGHECRVCRKPATGLFRRAFLEFHDISPATSITIGDSPRDVLAGRRAGTRTILIRKGTSNAASQADCIVGSLLEAVLKFRGRV